VAPVGNKKNYPLHPDPLPQRGKGEKVPPFIKVNDKIVDYYYLFRL